MGLFVIAARFEGDVPSEDAFRQELLAELGSLDELDSFSVEGKVVTVLTTLSPPARAYTVKVLLRLGGTIVDGRSREPKPAALPAFAQRPWRAWPWWKRASLHAGFVLAHVWNAIPEQRIL